MSKICVTVPTAYWGTDLTWHLHEPASVIRENGRATVVVETDLDPAPVLMEVRHWVTYQGLGSVVVDVDGERVTLLADPARA